MRHQLVCAAALGIVMLFPVHALAGDKTPPAAVNNLTVGVGFHSAVPTWTDTGDDGTVGTASSYEVRYSTSNITEANWNQAAVFCSGTPGASGTNECCDGVALSPGTSYYFAVRLTDDAHNISPLSNVVHITTHTSGNEVQC